MLCLFTAAGVLAASLVADTFTLRWTHSVEKVAWEEDWRVEGRHLVPIEARIRGSGAGMEPPPDAVLADGWWRYRPALPPQPRLVLARSGAVEEYRLCIQGRCRSLAELDPAAEPTVSVLAPCP